MKKILFYCAVATAFTACGNSEKIPAMEGTYFMNTMILNDGKTDTKYTDRKQLKMYTGKFYMYTQVNTKDSVSGFGVGSYVTNQDSGTITESVIYRASDSTFTDDPAKYVLHISLSADGYRQVIPDMVMDSTKYTLTEDYQRSGDSTKSFLNGVWKEIRSLQINGNDTTVNQRVQYKAYFNGYFMFGHYAKDSSAKYRTGVGFGTYKVINDQEIEETDLNSTYAVIAGHSFKIKVQKDGDDKYSQTIVDSTGSKSVEYYEKLKE